MKTVCLIVIVALLTLSSLFGNVKHLEGARVFLHDSAAAVALSADALATRSTTMILHEATNFVGGGSNSTGSVLQNIKTLFHEEEEDDHDVRPTIGYFVSMFSCSTHFRKTLHDGAAVLIRSIELNSYPVNPEAKYRASVNVFVLANERGLWPCSKILKSLGYNLIVRDAPLKTSDIMEGTMLRERIDKDGCCGAKELMKLEALRMEEYMVTVHLDFDTMLLQPLDELFDAIIHPPDTAKGKLARENLRPLVSPSFQYTVPLEEINFSAFYTKDYSGIMRRHAQKKVGLQGGFLVFRSNRTKLSEMVDMIKRGNYSPGQPHRTSGWFQSGYGPHIYGSMTIQGFLAYYFSLVTPDTAIELHRCKFNQAADNPRLTAGFPVPRNTPLNPKEAGYRDGACKDGRSNCDDVQCQSWPINDTRMIHFTGSCNLPWKCKYGKGANHLNHKVCGNMHKAWIEVRHELDPFVTTLNGSTIDEAVYRGYCKSFGAGGYIHIDQIRLFQMSNRSQATQVPKQTTAIASDEIVSGDEIKSIQQKSVEQTSRIETNGEDRPTVGYFISSFTCGATFSLTMYEAAAVLKRSIEQNSYPTNPNAKYRASINAFVMGGAPVNLCTDQLKELGYNVLMKELPVISSDIKNGTILSTRIKKDGCCGVKETMKLQVFEMDEYPIVVHLDFDTMLLQPLDELFDVMVHPPGTDAGRLARERLRPLVTPTFEYKVQLEDTTVSAFYTRDYGSILTQHLGKKIGLQGGFLVVRPNRTKLAEMVNLIKKGNFTPGRTSLTNGWFNSGFGAHIFGSMTIQGFLAYYFSVVTPDSAIELHRCKFNQVADNPRVTLGFPVSRNTPLNPTAAGYSDGDCKDERQNCDDVQCQSWPISDTRLLHFTGGCGLPWRCNFGRGADHLNSKLCGEIHKKWIDARHELDPSFTELDNSTFEESVYRGYCKTENETGYVRMDRERIRLANKAIAS